MVRPDKADRLMVGDAGFGKLVECPMCHDASSKRAFLNSLANLPAALRLANFTHDDFLYTTASRVIAAPMAQALVDQRAGWLTIWGGYGTGKSYVAAAAVNYALERGLPARFWEMAALLDHLRDAYDPRKGPGAFSQLFHDICECDLLVLDEADVFKPTDWAYAQFRQLVSYRYSNVTRLATIWVLNPEPRPGAKGFPGELDFLASRMSEFEIVKMDDGDIRPLR
jgi:DNA replication protein DnaC